MLRFLLILLLAGTTLAAEPDWTAYDELLSTHVTTGEKDGVPVNLVDYQGFAGDPRLDIALTQIRNFDLSQLQSNEEKLAYYINAYNLLTIKLIIDHWPVDSIRDIGNFFRGPWDRVVLETSEDRLTLDDIEHDIIRSFGEARIHFAVNCASVSCPDLRREAYRAEDLDSQLEEQTVLFLSNPKGLQADADNVRVSRIFDWYEDDFASYGGVENFVRQYRPELQFDDLEANLNYNWNLNTRR